MNGSDSENVKVILSIDGTEYEGIECSLPLNRSIRECVELFNLPRFDDGGNPLQYLLGCTHGDDEDEILELKDEDGREMTLMDYNVQSGDHLHLFSVPMACEKSFEDDIIIILSIDGTEYKEVEVKVTSLYKSVRDQISSFMQMFELPKNDCGGNPIEYLLCRIHKGEEEILELENKDGREITLLDYNIQSGDHLHLIPVPISGGSPTLPLSIPRKTSFLKSVRRWIKGLVTRREEINTTLFAPFMAERGTTMTIQVLFYRDSQYHQIKHEAQLVDPDATERSTRSLGIPVKKGDDLCAHLYFFTQQSEVDSIRIMNCERHIIWKSNLEILVFHSFVDRSFTRSVLNGNVDILLNGVPVSAIAFDVKIVDDMDNSKKVADTQPTQYDRVFISYSHADAEKVQYISETCRAVNCEYFFDRHILSPGDVFVEKIFHYIDNANLFILCWSQNAANSEWVERERKRALENWNKGGHSIRIYPISINPKADLPEDMKDTFIFGELS